MSGSQILRVATGGAACQFVRPCVAERSLVIEKTPGPHVCNVDSGLACSAQVFCRETSPRLFARRAVKIMLSCVEPQSLQHRSSV